MKVLPNTLFALVLTAVSTLGAQADTFKDDVLLTKLAAWHLGFTTNVKQHDADLAAGPTPAGH